MTPWIPAAFGVAAAGVLAAGTFRQNSRLFGPVIGRGSREDKVVYLTFDDGPNPEATPAILETLATEQVPAAFFQVGRHVEMFPEAARAVAAAGHEVGNHTFNHRKLHRLGPATIRNELDSAQSSIKTVTGRTPRVFRAPHGLRNPFVYPAAARLGCRLIGWTFGVWDTDRPGVGEIRRRVRTGLRNGAIILLHDGDGYDPGGDRTQTASALAGILSDARDAGFTFRPLADLLGSPGAAA